MGPLLMIMYCGLTHWVFTMDRLIRALVTAQKRSLWIPMSEVIGFKMSVSISTEVAVFCANWRLVYFFARAYASTCTLSSVYSPPCNIFVQKVTPQGEKLFARYFKDLHVTWVPKTPIIIPTGSTPWPGLVHHKWFEVYYATL
jgi:hypothetical protein